MREYERFNTVCANAYVQPLMASYLRSPARSAARARRRCTAVPGPLRRRPDERRDRGRVPGPTGRVGAGRRSDLRRRSRGPLRTGPGPVVRHGRHDRQDQPHRRRPTGHRQDLRGRPHGALQEGQRHAHLDSGHRHDRDRGRWRIDRERRLARPDPHRSAQRRLRARAGRVLTRGTRRDGHRCQPPTRPAPPRHVRGDRHRSLTRNSRPRRSCGRWGSGWISTPTLLRSVWPRSSTRTWPTLRGPTPSRTARTSAGTR